MKKVVIVGGGISGLSAAWELQKSAESALQITVLERENRWGGKVLTQTMPGPEGGTFIVDAGPESFVTRKREIWTLTRELGLQDRVIDPGGEATGTYVLDDGKPYPLPLSPGAMIKTPLLSTRGKLRMLAEPFMPRKGDDADESLADFVTRRLGREALDKFIGPVLGGIYNTDPQAQSILVTSPVMREMEREHRSLVLATVARMRASRKAAPEADPPPARFIGFEHGARELIDALVDQLDATMRLNAPVQQIEKANGEGYVAVLADGERIAADSVIFATPANVTARLLANAAPEASTLLQQIKHNSIGTISLAYDSAELNMAEPIRGLMIPRRERRRIDAVVWTSAKIPARAPEGYALLRVFFGGGDPTTATMPEDELLAVVTGELEALLGITAPPVDYRMARWPDSYAQAAVGHLELVESIERALPGGLYLTGASYSGLAVPDCIKQGRDTALTLINS